MGAKLSLPQLVPVAAISAALAEIFPEGVEQRRYLVRDIAARTIFTMLYVGAVEGMDRWLRPDQVTKMNDRQAAKQGRDDRMNWSVDSITPGRTTHVVNRWYAANTREPIRDETLRNGLVRYGAVIERPNIPTTSSAPRYALSREFTALLSLHAAGRSDFRERRDAWQTANLGAGALARSDLLRQGALLAVGTDRVAVVLPGRGTRHLHPGPSAVITKAVVEEFTRHFLRQPAVVVISQSGEKLDPTDRTIARKLGIQLGTERELPDLILFDAARGQEKLIFVEVVATDGPMTSQRIQALAKLFSQSRFKEASVRYVSAFSDRGSPAFRKCAAEIAWGTVAWFVSEPSNLLLFRANADLEIRASL